MISIIIPTLNEEHYILPLLKSIEQQLTQGEVIVVDGNSQDQTRTVIQDYAKTSSLDLRLLVADRRGVAFQRNTGRQHAKHDQLLFLDADVVLSNNFLDKALSEIRQENLKIAGTKIYSVEKHTLYRLGYWIYSNVYLSLLRRFNPVLHGCSIFIDAPLHDKIEGFTEDILFEDFEYARKAAAHSYPRLLKSVYIRTSARRFYSPSLRSLCELIGGALFSFVKAGIRHPSWMKEYNKKAGKHPLPKY